MNSIREVNRFILELVGSGGIDETAALKIIGKVNGIPEKKHCEIAVIGMECRFPGAEDKHEFWRAVKNGIDCSKNFPKSRAESIRPLTGKERPVHARGGFLDEIDKFDSLFFRLSPREALLMDPFQRIFLEVAYSAIEDAGYGGNKIVNTRTGVYVGVDTSNKYFYMKLAGGNDFLTLTGSLNSIISARLSYIFNLRGPGMVIDTACSSGLVALHEACSALKNNECEMAIAGGINLMIAPGDGGTTSDMTSADGETRSFDRAGTGFSWGEGAGAVLLKPFEKAARDKDNIYAIIKGSAINNDGASNGITAPNPAAQTDVILRAWKEAGIDPETLSYVEAHGTATELGDPIEIKGLTDAFGRFTDRRQFCGIGSVKTNIGHAIGASGMASLIKVILSLKYGEIPATLHFSNPNPAISFYHSPVFVNTRLKSWKTTDKVRRAGINSFGACGTNCHVVIEETGSITGSPKDRGEMPQILAISAKTAHALKQLLQRYINYLEHTHDISIDDMCYTANTGRGHYTHRAALIFTGLQDLRHKLVKLYGSGLNAEEAAGVYYEEHKVVGAAKKKKEPGEITERERRELGGEAAGLTEKIFMAQGTDEKLLHAVCGLYVKGAVFEWESLYGGMGLRRISLPTYPFEKMSYWADLPVAHEAGPQADHSNVYYITKWKEEKRIPGIQDSRPKGIMLIKDRGGMGNELAEALREKGETIIEVEIGSPYTRNSSYKYTISGTENDYTRLFKETGEAEFSKIVHMAALNREDGAAKGCGDLDEALRLGTYGLFHIIKAVAKNSIKRKLDILLISDHANEVTGNEMVLKPENAALFGFGKVIVIENSNTRCRCIDIDSKTEVNDLVSEIEGGYTAYHTAYRDGARYVEELQQADMRSTKDSAFKLVEDGLYIITGGTGGIGLEIGRYLAGKEKINLALIGRTALPERDRWEEIIGSGTDKGLCQKLEGIRDIQSRGANVVYYNADISEQEAIGDVIDDLRRNYGRIAGIFHCAGISGERITINKQADRMEAVLSPKVKGTWLMDNLTRQDRPDFFVMCSSIATLLPSVGQADYIAANSFMDAYAQYREKSGHKTLTVNWPLWKETGMGFNLGVDENEEPCKAIATKEAIVRLDELLHKEINRVILFEPNPDSKTPVNIDIIPIRLDNGVLEMLHRFMPESKGRNREKKQVAMKGREDGEYTNTELKVASIWSDILGVSELSIYDIFYELGGDSIQAIKIANTVNKTMNRSIQAGDVLEHLTVSELSEYLDNDTDTGIIPVEEASGNEDRESKEYELSNSQERFWFLYKFNPDLTAYNLSVNRIFDFNVDIWLLNRAMNLILKRHAALRTVFTEIAGVPRQVILPVVDFSIETVDISSFDHVMEQLKNLIEAENRKPSDLSKLLLRMKLYKLDEEKYCLYFNIHHIIIDGISMGIIEKELFEIIGAYKNGLEPSLPPVHTHYIDFVLKQKKWLDSPEALNMEQYWMRELAPPLPVLNLPVDYKRPADKTYNGDFIVVRLEKPVVEKLKSLAMEAGCTLHILLLTLYFTLLYKICSNNEIIVGVPITQRDNEELEKVVGLLLNTVCIKCDFEKVSSFRDLLVQIREKSIKGYKNAKYPFDLIVSKINPERDRSRSPIYSTLFQYFDNLQMDNENGSMMDISLQCRETDGRLEARFDFNTDLFMRSTAERIGGYFLSIVKLILENSNTGIADMEILQETEKDKLLATYNNTRADYSWRKTINELFEEQVERTPENTAAVFEDHSLTYRELNTRANKLAQFLRKEGVVEGCTAGIMTERTLDMLVGILGILKAGGAYLPLDPEYPADRIQYMLEDSNACVLLTQKHIKDKVEFGGKIIYTDSEPLQYEATGKPDLISTYDNPAYVIYTSGSTGKPKGVVIRHKALHNFIKGMSDIFELLPEMTMLCITTMSFDIFVLETLLPLTKGMKIVIAGEKEQNNPVLLSELMTKHQVDIMQTTPSRMQLIIGYRDSRAFLKQLRYILIGGEAFPPVLLRELKELTPARIFNMYGPTETTVWSTVKELTQEEDVCIGRPIANTRIYILDRHGRIQPTGVAGELCIAGDGLAKGYYNRPELTAEKFVNLSFEGEGKVYKTGDLAKWLPNGDIACMGRIDNQVKIRGYRIELGEIESCLLKHVAVEEAAVAANEDINGNRYLCAYYVSDRELSISELKEHLMKELPHYMAPSYFMRLESMPLTANGKVNRKALPEPSENMPAATEIAAPSNRMEQELLTIWKEILGVSNIGVNHSFFDMGGNSMLIVKLHTWLEDQYPGKISIPELFSYSTVSRLARHLSGRTETGDAVKVEELAAYMTGMMKSSRTEIGRAGPKEYYPSSAAQKRLHAIDYLGSSNTAYNNTSAMILENEISTERIEQVFRQLINRHEALRTSFHFANGESVQRIHDTADFHIEYEELDGPDHAAVLESFVRPFKLDEAPLFRVKIVKFAESKYLLALDMHHIISDGTSMNIMVSDFTRLYMGEELEPLRLQYKDFSEWQNRLFDSEEILKQERYWLGLYKEGVPTLELPQDYPRPPQRSFKGDKAFYRFDNEFTGRLKSLTVGTGLTPFMVLLAVYNIMLYKYTGQEDIIVGSPIAGRNKPGLDDIIGMFVNTLAFRNRPESGKSCVEFFEEVKYNCLDAYENQDYQIDRLIEKLNLSRDLSRNPLFDTMLILQNYERKALESASSAYRPLEIGSKVSKFDLTMEFIEKGDEMELIIEYCTELFRKETIDRLADHFKNILKEIACNPEKKLKDINMLVENERLLVLNKVNEDFTFNF